MADSLKIQKLQTPSTGIEPSTTKQEEVSGRDGAHKVEILVKLFEKDTSQTPRTNGPKTDTTPSVSKQRTVNVTKTPVLQRPGKVYQRPTILAKTAPKGASTTYNYKEYVQKFGSKTANLYEIENLGVKVPERSPVSSEDIFKHLESKDKGGVIAKSWAAMKKNNKVDDKNLKAITDKIEEIFDSGDFPFTKEQINWIEKTMAGKIIIARSTGDEDSADTPNAGGNESVLFVEPNQGSVQKAMKEVVLSYFGADSLRNRIVGDGEGEVLKGLPKMPVLLMEMIAEPIKDKSKLDTGERPHVGIAMSTNKLEFTGGEDFQFVSISSAVGPGVNEGSGRIEVDETFVMQAKDGTPLLIYQQPSVKEERIRAVKGENGKISHQLEKNSKELAYKPSLSREEVRSLVTSSDKIKKLNGGSTTEVEAVVGGDGAINFVQHRAIPDPKSKVAPTYVSTDKASGHSQNFGYTTVVPKSGDALVITDWSQVCFAETMKEAEAMFDWKGGTQKIVIVRQPDCSNSHPAVNFGSYKKDVGDGKKEPNPIPCLVVPNYGELLALKKNALAPNQPLIVDGQSQKLFVWKDATFDSKEVVLDGRISHHIGLDTSVTDEKIADLVGKLKTTASKDLAPVAKDLESTLGKYETKLKEYETLLTKNADTIHNSEGLKLRLETLKGNFAEVKRALNEVIEGHPDYTFDPETHARLLIVKFFESSMHDVDHFQDLIDVEKSASRYLQAAKGSPIDKPTFADQVGVVKDGLTGPLQLRWKRVLTLAEQSGMTQTEISDFKAMMEGLDKLGVTANWMSTVFDQKYAEIMPTDRLSKTPAAPSAKKLINELVKDYKTTSGFLLKQQVLQKDLAEVERGVSDFATPSKFDKAFEKLTALAQPLIDEEWPKDLNDNPLKKAVQVQTLGRLIEVFDGSIKALKSSSEPTDQLIAKELKMLDKFSELFESLFNKVEYKSDTPVTKPKYLSDLKEAYGKVKNDVAKTGVDKLDDHFRCGGSFNVTNALYNTGGKVMPGNVEEMFTTLHQGLEDIRSALMVGGSNYSIDMPPEMHGLLAAIPKFAMETVNQRPGTLVGREITATGVTYTYNMQINDHGIKIRAHYEKPKPGEAKGALWLEADFYADNAGNRLENMAKLANQFSLGGGTLNDPSRRDVVSGDKQLKVRFEVRSELDVKRVTTVMNSLSAFSIMGRPGGIQKNFNLLHGLVNQSNDFTTGQLPEKRRQFLNDFLNVALATAKGSGANDRRGAFATKDLNVTLTPSKDAFKFVDAGGDGTEHTLDLGRPKFGLSDDVFGRLPPDLLNDLKKEVIEGTRKFTFDYKGKSYAVDLSQDDLGLSARDLKGLGLNGKYLSDFKNDLSLAWENSLVDVKGDEGTRLKDNWPPLLFGTPMAYSKGSTYPELGLWKSMSANGKKRGELKAIDKSFERVLAAKYALHDAGTKLAEKGAFATPGDRKAHEKALKTYFRELSKFDLTCNGYIGKKISEGTFKPMDRTSAHTMVKDVWKQTRVQLKAVESQMLILGSKPRGLRQEVIDALPFSEHQMKN